MTQKKFSFDIFRETPIFKILNDTDAYSKLLDTFKNRIKDCVIEGVLDNHYIIDPFLLKNLIIYISESPKLLEIIGEDTYTELKSYTRQACNDAFAAFDVRLNEFCSRENVALDGRSPKYILDGFLKVEIIENELKCKVGSVEIKSLMFEAVMPTIQNIIHNEKTRLFDKSKFLNEMYLAYVRVTAINNIANGSAVPIKDIYPELIIIKQPEKFKKNPIKNNFENYTIDNFKRDLARVIELGSCILPSGKKIEFLPTSFSKEAFPVFVNGAIQYIGRIAFNEVL